MSTGSIALARAISPPVSKLAPLAFCAAIILFVSSNSVGMNLSAMLIIMAMSCTGTLMYLSGLMRLSVPSATSTGVVVRVSNDAPQMSKTSLKAIFMVV